ATRSEGPCHTSPKRQRGEPLSPRWRFGLVCRPCFAKTSPKRQRGDSSSPRWRFGLVWSPRWRFGLVWSPRWRFGLVSEVLQPFLTAGEQGGQVHLQQVAEALDREVRGRVRRQGAAGQGVVPPPGGVPRAE